MTERTPINSINQTSERKFERAAESETLPAALLKNPPEKTTDHRPVFVAQLFIAAICFSISLRDSKSLDGNKCNTKDSDGEIKTQFLARKYLIQFHEATPACHNN